MIMEGLLPPIAAAGTLPPEWGIQGYYIGGGLNNTQALEYM